MVSQRYKRLMRLFLSSMDINGMFLKSIVNNWKLTINQQNEQSGEIRITDITTLYEQRDITIYNQDCKVMLESQYKKLFSCDNVGMYKKICISKHTSNRNTYTSIFSSDYVATQTRNTDSSRTVFGNQKYNNNCNESKNFLDNNLT